MTSLSDPGYNADKSNMDWEKQYQTPDDNNDKNQHQLPRGTAWTSGNNAKATTIEAHTGEDADCSHDRQHTTRSATPTSWNSTTETTC